MFQPVPDYHRTFFILLSFSGFYHLVDRHRAHKFQSHVKNFSKRIMLYCLTEFLGKSDKGVFGINNFSAYIVNYKNNMAINPFAKSNTFRLDG